MAVTHSFREDKKVVVTLYCDVGCCQQRKIVVGNPWNLELSKTGWKVAVFRNEEGGISKFAHVCPRHSEKVGQ